MLHYFKEQFVWSEGFEPPTPSASTKCSTRLSYDHKMPEILAPGLYNRLQAFLPDDTCKFRSAMRSSFQLRDALRDWGICRSRTDASAYASDPGLQPGALPTELRHRLKLSWVRSDLTQAIGITHSAIYGFIVLSFASTIVFNKKRT